MPVLVLISRRDLTERNSPVTVGEFRWSDAHRRHLLCGRGLTGEEFNTWAKSAEWDRTVERDGAALRIEVVETELPAAGDARAGEAAAGKDRTHRP